MKEKAKEIAVATTAASLTALAPISGILTAVFGLVFLDWLTGVYRSIVVLKQPFTSVRMRDTAIKLVPYLCIVLGGFCVDHVLHFDVEDKLYFTRSFALLVISIEVQSLGENTGFNLTEILRKALSPPPKS